MATASAYPNPPDYYKDFAVPGFHLDPPRPMNCSYWNNGVIRNPKMPIVDYVSPAYTYFYDESKLDSTNDYKAETVKSLLHRLMKAYIDLLKCADRTDLDNIMSVVANIECTAMNIIRLLNKMRSYQLRENIIRSLQSQIEDKTKLNDEIQLKINEAKTILNSSLQNLSSIVHDEIDPSTSIPEKAEKQSNAITELIQDLDNIKQGNYLRTEKEKERKVEEEKKEDIKKEEEMTIEESSTSTNNAYQVFINEQTDIRSDAGLSFTFDGMNLGLYLCLLIIKRN